MAVSNRHNEWSKKFQRRKEFWDKVENLNTTEKRESSEESHGASDKTQLGLGLDLLVSLDVVKGCRVKVDPDKSEVWFNWNLNSWSKWSLFDKRGKLNSYHSLLSLLQHRIWNVGHNSFWRKEKREKDVYCALTYRKNMCKVVLPHLCGVLNDIRLSHLPMQITK